MVVFVVEHLGFLAGVAPMNRHFVLGYVHIFTTVFTTAEDTG